VISEFIHEFYLFFNFLLFNCFLKVNQITPNKHIFYIHSQNQLIYKILKIHKSHGKS